MEKIVLLYQSKQLLTKINEEYVFPNQGWVQVLKFSAHDADNFVEKFQKCILKWYNGG
jgi:hypothetical protein